MHYLVSTEEAKPLFYLRIDLLISLMIGFFENQRELSAGDTGQAALETGQVALETGQAKLKTGQAAFTGGPDALADVADQRVF